MEKNIKKIIKQAFLLIVIVLIILLILDFIYFKFIIINKQVYRQEKAYQDYIHNLPNKQIDYAFFGDSHCHDAINPEYIENSFNFATSGESYARNYYKLKRVIEKDNVNINNIILEIDLHSLSTPNLSLMDDLQLYSKFTPLKEIKKLTGKSYFNILTEIYFPFVGKGDQFLFLLKKQDVKKIYRGWVRQEGDFSLIEDKKNSAEQTYTLLFKDREQINPVVLDYFRKTIELAYQNNINLIFIKYPASEELDNTLIEKNISKQGYYSQVFSEIEKIVGDNYIVLDYYASFFNNISYFYDSNHLNYKGAEIFSKKVNQDLQEFSNKTDFDNKNNIVNIQLTEADKYKNNTFYLVFLSSLLLELVLLIILIKKSNNKA